MASAIPKVQLPGLRAIASLSPEDFEHVVAFFGTVQPTLDASAVEKALLGAVPALGIATATSVTDGSLGIHVGFQSVDEADFVSDVVRSLAATPGEEGLETEVFERRLNRLLSIKNLEIIARARGLIFEAERHLFGARVISDIRPVFTSDNEPKAIGAVITHTLRLHVHEHGESHDIFISIDSKDIKGMIDALQRALAKEKSIKSLIAATGMQTIDVSSGGPTA